MRPRPQTAKILIVLFSILLLPLSALSQGEVRERVVRLIPQSTDPVEITALRVRGNPLNFGQPFSSNDDWVRGLAVNVRNISGRNIIYARVALNFPLDDLPDGNPDASVYRINLVYGYHPQSNETALPEITPLAPGGTVTLTVSEVEERGLRRTLRARGVGRALLLTRAKIFTEVVFFDQNTMWGGDRIYRRDPSTRQWNPVTDQTSLRLYNRTVSFISVLGLRNPSFRSQYAPKCYNSQQHETWCCYRAYNVTTYGMLASQGYLENGHSWYASGRVVLAKLGGKVSNQVAAEMGAKKSYDSEHIGSLSTRQRIPLNSLTSDLRPLFSV